MSGLRRTPALFDHLGAVEESKPVGRDPTARPSAAPRSADAGTIAVASRWLRRSSPSEADGRGEALRAAPAGLLSMQDDRIVVSLSSVSAAVVVFLAVVSVIGAFEIGHRKGRTAGVLEGFDRGALAGAAGTGDEVDAVREGPVQQDLLSGAASNPSPGAVPTPKLDASGAPSRQRETPGTANWVKGRTYVVIQEFGRDAESDARKAQLFLQSRGVESDVVRLDGGALRLISKAGYDRQDAKERGRSDELIEKIRTAGAEYYKSGGGYKLEGYFATLRQDRW